VRSSVLALVACLAVACSSNPTATGAPPTAAATPAVTVAATPTASPAPTVDPLLGTLIDAADQTLATKTVSYDQTVEFNGSSQIPNGTSISATGATSLGPPRQMTIDGDFSALNVGRVRMILDDTLLYLRGEFVEELIDPGQWLLVDLASDDPAVVPFLSLTSGQNDSSLTLYFLYGAEAPVEEVGDETINGIATTHYRTTVDLNKAVDEAPEAATESLLDNIAGLRTGGVEQVLDADVWIGDDGLVHRVDYEYTVGRAGGGGTMDVSNELSDFGDPLELGIPDEEDVVNIEDL
jgi:hypothetical protein